MMKKIRNLSLSFAIMFLLICFLGIALLFRPSDAQALEMAKEKNAISVYQYGELYELFLNKEIQTRSAVHSNIPKYQDNYGGMYIDDDNELNICYTGKVNQKARVSEISKYQMIKTQQVEFSLNELNVVQEALESAMTELNISIVSENIYDNCIDVSVSAEEFVPDVIDYLDDLGLYDQDVINIQVEDIEPQAAYYAYPGTKTSYKYGFLNLNTRYGTICANAYDNVTGQYGILTNAHVAVEGETMRNQDNQKIGVRTRGYHSGTIDAAFVPFPNGDWKPQYYIQYTSGNITYNYGASGVGDESDIVTGAMVYKYGVTTSKTTGKITSTNSTATLEYSDSSGETTITDVIRYSNESLGGDSGGPVLVEKSEPYGKKSVWLIGCHFAGPKDPDTYTFGIACKITNVIEELNITIVDVNYWNEHGLTM